LDLHNLCAFVWIYYESSIYVKLWKFIWNYTTKYVVCIYMNRNTCSNFVIYVNLREFMWIFGNLYEFMYGLCGCPAVRQFVAVRTVVCAQCAQKCAAVYVVVWYCEQLCVYIRGAHCHTLLWVLPHIVTHYRTQPRTLPHTDAVLPRIAVLPYTRCRTLPHCHTLPHTTVHRRTPPHCRTLMSALPYTYYQEHCPALPHTATRTACTAVLPSTVAQFLSIQINVD
jgi:hypothetical protein